MERQLLRATPMARLCPYADLHIFTKGAFGHTLSDSELITDGFHGNSELWEAATC